MGRAARQGRCGTALNLVDKEELPYMVELHLFLARPLQGGGEGYTLQVSYTHAYVDTYMYTYRQTDRHACIGIHTYLGKGQSKNTSCAFPWTDLSSSVVPIDLQPEAWQGHLRFKLYRICICIQYILYIKHMIDVHMLDGCYIEKMYNKFFVCNVYNIYYI